MRPHALRQKTSVSFNRKAPAAPSVFEMTRRTVSDARTFGCVCRTPRTSRRFARQIYLAQSCACATENYSADLRANGGYVPTLFLFDPESVPQANVQTVAPPPTEGGQLCMLQTGLPLLRKRRGSLELHDQLAPE